jgi:hypothetical protein
MFTSRRLNDNAHRLYRSFRAHKRVAPPTAEEIGMMVELDATGRPWRLGPDWVTDADLVGAFYVANGRWPSKHGRGSERRLGQWLETQKVAINHPERPASAALTPERVAYLDEVASGWSQSQVRTFEDWVAALRQYVDTHGRAPSTGTYPGQWLARTRRAYLDDPRTLTIAQVDTLDAVAPGWSVDPTAGKPGWEDNARALGAWVTSNGRLPKFREPSDEGKALISWLSTQREASRAGKLSGEQLRLLDQLVPGWERTRQPWEEMADACAAFLRHHGRLPQAKNSKQAGRDEEAMLAKWLNKQRYFVMHPNGWMAHTLTPERKAYLDLRLPGWDRRRPIGAPKRPAAPRTQDGAWQARADAAVRFYRANDRWPSQWGKDRNEAQLGQWLADQRWAVANPGKAAARKLTPARKMYFDVLHPGWDQPQKAGRRTVGSR